MRVETIGDEAFAGCSNLDLLFPNSLRTIGYKRLTGAQVLLLLLFVEIISPLGAMLLKIVDVKKNYINQVLNLSIVLT